MLVPLPAGTGRPHTARTMCFLLTSTSLRHNRHSMWPAFDPDRCPSCPPRMRRTPPCPLQLGTAQQDSPCMPLAHWRLHTCLSHIASFGCRCTDDPVDTRYSCLSCSGKSRSHTSCMTPDHPRFDTHSNSNKSRKSSAPWSAGTDRQRKQCTTCCPW